MASTWVRGKCLQRELRWQVHGLGANVWKKIEVVSSGLGASVWEENWGWQVHWLGASVQKRPSVR